MDNPRSSSEDEDIVDAEVIEDDEGDSRGEVYVLSDEVESTAERESKQAQERVREAQRHTETSAAVLSDWQRALGSFRELYENNGFGEDMLKIMRSPVRKAS